MSKHRLDLHQPNVNDKVDTTASAKVSAGELSLGEGAGITAEQIGDLRRQAAALAECGEWQRCIDIVLGVVALGTVHPTDAILLALAYEGLGEHDKAAMAKEHANRLTAAFSADQVEEEIP